MSDWKSQRIFLTGTRQNHPALLRCASYSAPPSVLAKLRCAPDPSPEDLQTVTLTSIVRKPQTLSITLSSPRLSTVSSSFFFSPDCNNNNNNKKGRVQLSSVKMLSKWVLTPDGYQVTWIHVEEVSLLASCKHLHILMASNKKKMDGKIALRLEEGLQYTDATWMC